MLPVAKKPKHSPIGASSASRWIACPGSVRLSKNAPKFESSYAIEGTLAHEIAGDILLGKKIKSPSDEMLAHVLNYVDFVKAEAEGNDLYVEKGFDLSDTLYPGLYGTSDAVVFDRASKVLKVIDFKYGAGVAVSAENNTQLKYYALGAMYSLNLPADKVELIIYQPRAMGETVKRWMTDVITLMDFGAELIEYAKRTNDPDASLKSGDHCRFCPAATQCPELERKALDVAVADFSEVKAYSPEKIRIILEKAPLIRDYLKTVEEFAFNEMLGGAKIPGFKLVDKRSTRKWRDENEVVNFARESGLLDDEIFETSLRSPAQLEKFLDKENKKALQNFVTSTSSGLTLAPENDKRPASRPDAVAEFTKIE